MNVVAGREAELKASVVELILDYRPEEAIKMLSEYYHVSEPRLRVGRVRGHVKSRAVYVAKDSTIYISRREYLYDPYTILHEFYHHLRSTPIGHRGTERYADTFARSFILEYRRSKG